MHGVRERILATACVFLAMASPSLIAPVSAVELGNMLFPPVAEPSREASALALSAISDAVQAFEKRELNDPKASQELISKSRDKLRRAADKMAEILKGISNNPELKRYFDGRVSLDRQLSKEDAAFYSSWARDAGAKEIQDRYEGFRFSLSKRTNLLLRLRSHRLTAIFFVK
jgi:hypothetical protein